MPLPKEKYEAKLQGYLGVLDKGGQASFAVSNHAVLLASGSFYNDGGSKRDIVDVGAGYYVPIGKNGCFEIIGGGSNGNTSGGYNNRDFFGPGRNISSLVGNYQRAFLQADIGISGGICEFGLGCRISDMFLHNIRYKTWFQDKNATALNPTADLVFNGNYTLLEPGARLGLGYKNFKFMVTGGLSFLQYDHPVPLIFPELFVSETLSFGVLVTLGRKWDKSGIDFSNR